MSEKIMPSGNNLLVCLCTAVCYCIVWVHVMAHFKTDPFFFQCDWFFEETEGDECPVKVW